MKEETKNMLISIIMILLLVALIVLVLVISLNFMSEYLGIVDGLANVTYVNMT